MRAAVIRALGGPEVFEIIERENPTTLPTEVLIRVQAAGLNPVEALVRSGAFPLVTAPATLGWDVSGVVEEVAPGVARFVVGDEVFGMPFFPRPAQAYAEYVAAPSRQLAKKPARLSHAQAAALPLAGLTAYQSLVDIAHVRPGQRVLVHGGGGGVGHVAIQIARALGAYVVTTASAGKHEFVRSLGADEVIDYRSDDFTKRTGDIDVVLEMIGGDYGPRSIEVLRPGGLLVSTLEGANLELAARVKKAGRRFAGVSVEPDYVGLEALAALVEQGKLSVHVSETFPLAQVADAHRKLGQSIQGKLVLTM
ncbi:MAG: Alcohol dehydrogenase zinc-binding domain protein [Myxococcaceae bacterium]|nr:Alcohol dehydrogenase zinc-binding domain protein [Myxococcaceae bacterium]